MSRKTGFTTAILHSDRDAGIEHGALHKPLHLSVAYGYRDARDLAAVFQGRAQGYAYGRQGNPTTAALEAKVTKMEDGVATVCFATGMAAIGAAMLALLREGDHVVSSQFLFGNTVSLFGTLAAHGTEIAFVDATDVANVERALTPSTRLVFVETIANPRTQVADLARIGKLCAERGILYIVDNTMTSPALFRPKTVGAGLVVNALTKYIGGHGNALAGSITDTGLFDWTRFPNIADNYKTQPRRCGASSRSARRGCATGAARWRRADAHHIAVGAETLALRMERVVRTRMALASYLEPHPKVRAVYYPGCLASAARAREIAVRARSAGSFVRARPTGSTVSISSIASRSSCRRRISATTARSRYRSRTRSSGRWAPSRARRWASPTR